MSRRYTPFSCFLIGEQGTLLIQCGEILLAKGHSVLGVISPNPVTIAWAKAKGLPHVTSTRDLIQFLRARPFDYLFSVASWALLPTEVLTLPQRFAVNYHDSLLPRYGGGNATTWAIMNQEVEHGISWHVMSSMVDAGDILQQVPVRISANETAFSLNSKCYEAAIGAFAQLIEELATGMELPRQQDPQLRTYFSRHQKPQAAGVIAWKWPAAKIDALVRSLDFGAYPNLVCLPRFKVGDNFVRLGKLEVLDQASTSAPGTIVTMDRGVLRIATGSVDLAVHELWSADGQKLSILGLARQFGLREGDRLPDLDHETAARIDALSQECAKLEAFWLARLQDSQPLVMPLATMRTPSPDQAPPARLEWSLPLAVQASLGRRHPEWQAEDFLVAAFAVYLGNLGGNSTFDLGLTTSEVRTKLSGLEGLFAVSLPCRIKLDPEQSFEANFGMIISELALAKKNKTYPLDLATRHGGSTNGQEFPVWVELTETLASSPVASRHGLGLVVPWGGKSFRWDYDPTSFAGQDLERLFHHFIAFVERLADSTAIRLADLALVVSKPELNQLLVEWNDTAAQYPKDRCLHQLFEEQVREYPERTALVFLGQRLTYAQVNVRANQLARHLRERGVKPESIVGITIDRSPEMVFSLLGVMKAGGAYLPLDANYPASRIEYLAANSGMEFILARQDSPRQAHIPPNFAGEVILLEDPRIAQQSGLDPEAVNVPSHPAYVIYTSGSTGEPKGVVIEHRSLVNYLCWAKESYVTDLKRPTDRGLSFPLFTSLSFDLTVTSLFVPLISGSAIVVYEEDQDQGELAISRVIKDNAVDVIKLTPAHLSVVKELNLAGSRIKRMIIGGEDLQTGLAKAISEAMNGDVEIYNEYGPTEATVGCMIHRFNPQKDCGPSVPIGKPAANVQLYILDRYLQPLPVGVCGELHISGVGLARGYLNSPESSGKSFIPSPFVPGQRLYRTGDLARWRPDGVMEYLGRIDQQVKVRGYRIELSEIESRLLRHEGINQCVVEARQEEIPPVKRPGSYCSRCGLPANTPDTHFDGNGVCGGCLDFDTYKDRAMAYFKTLQEFRALFPGDRQNSGNKFDCLMLYSGGKDSTYVLYQLVKEMKLKVLAFTFDNGYISQGAKENIRRVVNELGVELITGQSPHMNEIYVDSLKHFSNVCNGCFKTIYVQSMNLCHEKGIPYIITGLSRGQLFETRLAELHGAGIFDPERIDKTVLESRKLYHGVDDLISRRLDVGIFQDSSIFDRIRFLDFFRYSDVTVAEIFDYLNKNAPWVKPSAGGCSTNCLVNDAGIYVHERERGYHNYAVPNSWEVRLGHKARETAIAELEEDVEEAGALRILKEIGYQVQDKPLWTDKYLVAYYTCDARISSKGLREYLLQSLPDYMVPSFFVKLDRIPLTTNGKVDRRALPAPERRGQRVEQDYVKPATDTEQRIAAIWGEFLRLERVGARDDFFELGGQSLIATQILARMSDLFSVELPLSSLIKNPTVGSQAQLIEMIRQTSQFDLSTLSANRESGVI